MFHSDMKWRKFNGEALEGSIVEQVEKVLITESTKGNKLKVCIGSDSQVTSGTTEFATVIVFLRERRGGFMYISSSKTRKQMSLKERMITEVSKSVEVAYALCQLLDIYRVELEVHADINTDPAFPSNVALREAMGYIRGMGFKFKAKPEAFASSCCADKMV